MPDHTQTDQRPQIHTYIRRLTPRQITIPNLLRKFLLLTGRLLHRIGPLRVHRIIYRRKSVIEIRTGFVILDLNPHSVLQIVCGSDAVLEVPAEFLEFVVGVAEGEGTEGYGECALVERVAEVVAVEGYEEA